MITTHILGSLAERFYNCWICLLIGSLIFSLSNYKFLWRKFSSVNQLGIFNNCLVSIAAYISNDFIHDFSCGKIYAKKFFVGFPNARIQFNLIKGWLLQQFFYSFQAHILYIDYSHFFSSSAIAKICFKSSVSWLILSNFSLKLTLLQINLAVASII